jgi:magnesium chelatase subunit I
VPKFIKEIIAEVTFQARGSHEINQRSGVSVRTTIANYESILAAAEKRGIKMGEREVSPRITDFPAILPSTIGKIELEYLGEDTAESNIVEKIIKRAIKIVFDSYFPSLNAFSDLLESFEHGYVEVSDTMPSEEYLVGIKEIKGLKKCVEILGIEQTPAQTASAVEFMLEGLHLSNKLNKEKVRGRIIYK